MAAGVSCVCCLFFFFPPFLGGPLLARCQLEIHVSLLVLSLLSCASSNLNQRRQCSGVPDLRAPRNRPEIPLLCPCSLYPRSRANSSYLGIRLNSLLRREISLLVESKSSQGGKSRAEPGYSLHIQVEKSSGLKRHTACMGHPWRSLHLWHVQVGGPGALFLSSHRPPAAQGMTQTAARERLPRHLFIIGVSSLLRRRRIPESRAKGREQRTRKKKTLLSVRFPRQAKNKRS